MLPSLALLAATLCAQVPVRDSRDQTPNTDTHFTMPRYSTLAEWNVRRSQLRQQILSAAGLNPLPEKSPLRPRITGRPERDGYTVEKVLIETFPNYYLGGNLYRPARQGTFPAVLSPHGHWKHGRLENTAVCSVPGRCANLALQGYVVFAYDMVGYNDTKQTGHAFGGKAEQLWSFGPLGLQLWNSIRALDFLASLPGVDATRIGATGASGGGTQTFLLAAVDDRIAFSSPVNMISAIMQGGDYCENAPGLRIGTCNVEIGAMMAPRPMLMVSASGDWTRNTPHEEFPAIRAIYDLYDKRDNVQNVHVDAGHNYNRQSREAVYRFFARHVLNDPSEENYSDRDVQAERDEDMLSLNGGSFPPGAVNYEQLFDGWKAMSRQQFRAEAGNAALRERLRLVFASEWPTEVWHDGTGEKIALSRVGRGDRVPALWRPGTGAPVLIVHPDGSAAAKKSPMAAKYLETRRPVLMIDAFQTGDAIAPREDSHRYFLSFNLTNDANRVQDILTALAFLGASRRNRVVLVGLDRAAVWAVFAAALSPARVRLEADLNNFRGTDEDYMRNFFVPGIQRAGGLEAAIALSRHRRR